MHARVTSLQMDPSRLDDVVGQFERDEIPKWHGIDGFKSATLLVDRQSGKLVATSYWEAREAMETSEDQARLTRERVAETGAARSPSDLELVMLHGRHVLVTGAASGPPSVERFEVAVETMA